MQKQQRPWWRKPWVGSSVIGVAVALTCGFASALPSYDVHASSGSNARAGGIKADFGSSATQQYSVTPLADDYAQRGFASPQDLGQNGVSIDANAAAGFAMRTDELRHRLPAAPADNNVSPTTRRGKRYQRSAVPNPGQPALAIIIDDLGYSRRRGERAVKLPGPMTFAVLPQTPHGRTLAKLAKLRRNEVILHQPMQPSDRNQDKNMGRGGLTVGMSARNIARTLDSNLASLPEVDGVSNHMGSLFTRDAGAMNKLVGAVRERLPGAYFLDSLTSPASVAAATAKQSNVPTTRRDFFLDHVRSEKAIARQLRRAVRLAKKEGTAIAIGHPYPETLRVLERELPRLRRQGVQLVTVSDIIARRTPRQGYAFDDLAQRPAATPVVPAKKETVSAIQFSKPEDVNQSLKAKLDRFGL